MNADLAARVRAWIADDPDPCTRAELEALLAAQADAELADRFAGRLEFGTAGLRGVLGGGPNRMNRAVVIAATSGLCEHLLASGLGDRGVVICYDGRRLSREFAEEAARVVAGRGLVAHLFTELGPTPLAAYAVGALGVGAGIMITASHNPPEYNGYKAYWNDGAQIVPPTDGAIAAAIERVGSIARVPRPSLAEARAAGLVLDVPARVRSAYLDAISALVQPGPGRDALGIVYTAMHGVGGALVKEALARAGFARVHLVAEQFEPDGAFPTVAFPNPEEPGALDLSLALAQETGADIVLANDPDADRLAVAARRRDGTFAALSGNEIGALLAGHTVEGAPDPARALAITTIVSSPFLGAMCERLGVRYEETLTGFKWIANRAMALLASEGLDFRFGYEEALGYTVGTIVRDKDGVGSALVLADLAAREKAGGRTLWERLDELYRRYGYYASGARNVTHKGQDGAQRIAATMEALRAAPPAQIGEAAVRTMTDVGRGVRVRPGGHSEPISLPRSNVIAFALADGSRVTVRPSGTEPKIKFYFDVREEVRGAEPMGAARERASVRLAELERAFMALVKV